MGGSFETHPFASVPGGGTPPRPPTFGGAEPPVPSESSFQAGLSSLLFKQKGKTQNISERYLDLPGGRKASRDAQRTHAPSLVPARSQRRPRCGLLPPGPCRKPPAPARAPQKLPWCQKRSDVAGRGLSLQHPSLPSALPSPVSSGRTLPVPIHAEEEGSDRRRLPLYILGPAAAVGGQSCSPPSTPLPLQVEAWDGTAQHGSRSRHDLQSNTQYAFQVRCRLSPAGSPWSAWSTPFLYTTPEAGTLSLGAALPVVFGGFFHPKSSPSAP